MNYEVLLTADATADLLDIVDWIAVHDTPARAEQMLARIESAIASLARFPERGGWPSELQALGIREYRETAFKPHRIVYRVEGRRAYVYLIADARRDLQSVLAQRLLGA